MILSNKMEFFGNNLANRKNILQKKGFSPIEKGFFLCGMLCNLLDICFSYNDIITIKISYMIG